MGSYTAGVYVPSIGETNWGDEFQDFLTHMGKAYIDVTQAPYGATGNGSTDDTTAIRAAITAANAAGGGVVYFPKGTYIVSGSGAASVIFTFFSNTVFRGDPGLSRIKVKNNSGDFAALFGANGAGAAVSNVVFRDLTFDSNPTGNTTCDIGSTKEETGLRFEDSTHCLVDNCRFDPWGGVWSVTAGNLNGNDIHVRGCYFNFVRMHCTAPNGDYDNSTVYIQSYRHSVVNCTFVALPGAWSRGAIEMHSGDARIIGNTVHGFETLVNIVGDRSAATEAATVTGAGNTIVANNTAYDCMFGITFWNDETTLSNIVVANNALHINQIDRHGGEGRQAGANEYFVGIGWIPGFTLASTNIVITGNTIRFQSPDTASVFGIPGYVAGISTNGNGDLIGVEISHNTVLNAPGVGIFVRGGTGAGGVENHWVTGCTVHGNIIVDAGRDAAMTSYYRTALIFGYQVRGLMVDGNVIMDTGSGALNGLTSIRSSDVMSTALVTIGDNTVSSVFGTLAQALGRYSMLRNFAYPGTPASQSAAAAKGSLWTDTSAGKLYINTDGNTTWVVVGSQS